LRNPLPFIEKLFREYGDVVSARFLNFPVYIVAHQEGIKHVLQENHRNYTKSQDYVILATAGTGPGHERGFAVA